MFGIREVQKVKKVIGWLQFLNRTKLNATNAHQCVVIDWPYMILVTNLRSPALVSIILRLVSGFRFFVKIVVHFIVNHE